MTLEVHFYFSSVCRGFYFLLFVVSCHSLVDLGKQGNKINNASAFFYSQHKVDLRLFLYLFKTHIIFLYSLSAIALATAGCLHSLPDAVSPE